MSNKGLLGLAVVLIGGIYAVYAFSLRTVPAVPPVETSVHDFTMKNIDGREIRLDEYKDKVVLIVNTASKCGLTPQYEGLQNLYDKYKDKGFFVLGFPANNFMRQDPGTEQEIKEFCTLKYKVTFPMFSKISVKGDNQHALYRYLTGQKDFGGDITWNFEKFLVDGNGRVIARFSPSTKPDDPALVAAVEKALK
ncbi:MAG: glutathione peroxidase [Acidobacteria bacterium]|nr:glutathione peroxidase [Acidobacteriota bacterium]